MSDKCSSLRTCASIQNPPSRPDQNPTNRVRENEALHLSHCRSVAPTGIFICYCLVKSQPRTLRITADDWPSLVDPAVASSILNEKGYVLHRRLADVLEQAGFIVTEPGMALA